MHTNIEMEFTTPVVLLALKTNYERYQNSRGALLKAYEESVEVYQKEYRKYSHKVASDTLTEDDEKPVEPMVPVDRSVNYKQWIDFFSKTSGRFVTLTFAQYRQVVLDKWTWIFEHVSALRTYSTTTWMSTSASANLAAFADSYDPGE